MFFSLFKWRYIALSVYFFIFGVGLYELSPEVAFAQNTPTQNATGVVNINTATQEELQRLPGIGEAKAQAILERRAHRPFRRLTDLLRVSGIGRRTLERLTPFLTLEGPTTLPPRHRH